MSNDPYQIGDVEYWKEGNITRFDPNSLAFKKRVYGTYRNTSIMSDKDSQKSGIQFLLNSNDTTISKNNALAEKQRLNQFNGWFNSQFTKSGTWQQRLNKQQAAQAYRRLEDINNRIIIIDSILSNPVNIQRWENEAYVIKQAEERLRQIELENQRVQEIENQRLQEIENQRLMEIERIQQIENQRVQEIENQRLMEIENQRLQYDIIEEEKRIRRINELQEIENQRLMEIERIQQIENQRLQDEIIPVVVASSSLIPLAVIGLLLYTSRGKK